MKVHALRNFTKWNPIWSIRGPRCRQFGMSEKFDIQLNRRHTVFTQHMRYLHAGVNSLRSCRVVDLLGCMGDSIPSAVHPLKRLH